MIQYPKMTKQLRFFVFAALISLSMLLSACTGRGIVESWPGITVPKDSQTVYIADGSQIYMVDLGNGAETGRYPAQPASKETFYAPPVVTADGNLLEGSYNFTFYSIKPGVDQPNWTFTEAKDRYIASPLIVNDLVLAPSADGRLYALQVQTGKKVWEFIAEHALWSRPATDGKLIYLASTDHHVYALNPDNGQQVWKSDDLGGQIVATPVLGAQGVLYTAIFGAKTDDPARTSQLIALDTQTGHKNWNMPVSGWVWASPLFNDGTLYFGDSAGYFYAVNADNGNLVWKYPASGTPKPSTSILGAPAVIGDKVYFGSEAGTLTILNRADGTSPVEKTIGGQIYSDLVVTGDVILMAPINFKDAILVAVDPDGNLKWQFLPAAKK